MDLDVLRHPAVLAVAVLVGLAGLVLELLVYRDLRALKLKRNEAMPTPLLYRLMLGGFLVSLALLVYLLPTA